MEMENEIFFKCYFPCVYTLDDNYELLNEEVISEPELDTSFG